MSAVVHTYWSPIGPIKITAVSSGIACIDMQFGKKYCPKAREEGSEKRLSFEQIESLSDSDDRCRHIKDCIGWFDVYFQGEFDRLKLIKFPQLNVLKGDESKLMLIACHCMCRTERSLGRVSSKYRMV